MKPFSYQSPDSDLEPQVLSSTLKDERTLIVYPRKVRSILFMLIALLVLASIAGSVLKHVFNLDNSIVNVFIRFFNLALEENVPTLISFLLLIAASGTSALTWYVSRMHKQTSLSVRGWLILSFVFLFLSFDEALQIHETLNRFSAETVKISPLLYYSWTIPYSLLSLLTAFFLLRLVRSLPKKIASLFIASGLLYAGGAILFEFLEGYAVHRYGIGSIADVVLYTIEETCELSGVALYLYAGIKYLSHFQLKLVIAP